jgi:hypothetical protein
VAALGIQGQYILVWEYVKCFFLAIYDLLMNQDEREYSEIVRLALVSEQRVGDLARIEV